MPPPESGSDGENYEKPVREQLKQTTIAKSGGQGSQDEAESAAGKSEEAVAESDGEHNSEGSGNPPPKATQKRPLDDAGPARSSPLSAASDTASDHPTAHTRKRTRDDGGPRHGVVATEGHSASGEKKESPPMPRTTTPPSDCVRQPDFASVTSPRKKRSRESLDADEETRHQKIPSTNETRARRSSSEERAESAASDLSNRTVTKAS